MEGKSAAMLLACSSPALPLLLSGATLLARVDRTLFSNILSLTSDIFAEESLLLAAERRCSIKRRAFKFRLTDATATCLLQE